MNRPPPVGRGPSPRTQPSRSPLLLTQPGRRASFADAGPGEVPRLRRPWRPSPSYPRAMAADGNRRATAVAQRLLIIRGNSGSGKTAAAKQAREVILTQGLAQRVAASWVIQLALAGSDLGSSSSIRGHQPGIDAAGLARQWRQPLHLLPVGGLHFTSHDARAGRVRSGRVHGRGSAARFFPLQVGTSLTPSVLRVTRRFSISRAARCRCRMGLGGSGRCRRERACRAGPSDCPTRR